MKLVLINPPNNLFDTQDLAPPVGLLSLAAALEQEDIDIELIDFNLRGIAEPDFANQDFYARAVSIVQAASPDVIGMTSMVINSHIVLELSKQLKAQNPDLKIVLGGTHFFSIAEEVLSFYPWVDYVVKGEGEIPFRGLIRLVKSGLRLTAVNAPANVAFREGEHVASSHMLKHSLLALINPGDEVVVADPTYAGMIYRVKLAGGIPVSMPQVEERGWRIDLERLERVFSHRTKVIFLMSPNMPTGTVYTEEELMAISAIAEKYDLCVLYNASLDKIIFNGLKNINIASLPGMRDRTIVVGSVSKNYNMIGWRIGWAAANRKIIGELSKAHIYNAVTPSGIAQAGAVAALTGPQDCVRDYVSIYEARGRLLAEGLNTIAGLSVVKPDGGWYQIANIKALELDSYSFSDTLLGRGRVSTTPMRDWGSLHGEGYVRFIFSTEPEARIIQAIDRVKQVVAEL